MDDADRSSDAARSTRAAVGAVGAVSRRRRDATTFADDNKNKSHREPISKDVNLNIKRTIKEYQNFIKKNFDYVGSNFAYEARSIHYDKKKSQGIYGKATPEETSELIEEGIDIATIPWVDKSEN